MRDAFINTLNTQRISHRYINDLSDNLLNVYTPGYRAKELKFKTFLDGSMALRGIRSNEQGKSTPSTSDDHLYIEGAGYFVLRNNEGRLAYTRLGEFKFDGDGIYRSPDGQTVQGYLLNENGEIMNGAKPVDAESFVGQEFRNGKNSIPTTNVKLWIDPSNGKYLGKYEEFEVKDDGILYGKADDGKIKTPLYKIAIINFNNPHELFEIANNQFIETENSGKAYIGKAEVRNKVIESSNVDFTESIATYQQVQTQLSFAEQTMKSYRTLLSSAMDLLSLQ